MDHTCPACGGDLRLPSAFWPDGFPCHIEPTNQIEAEPDDGTSPVSENKLPFDLNRRIRFEAS